MELGQEFLFNIREGKKTPNLLPVTIVQIMLFSDDFAFLI